ncbi:MAG: ferrous iron transporter B [Planctomycetota bacterium]|nr:ferrous iron transporter B [Planctomycetota bacterium]
MSHCETPTSGLPSLADAQDVNAFVHLALVGSPNSGKTTLFNALTGLRARTGNYPGVTVDRRVGRALHLPDSAPTVVLSDLPGLYSLEAISQDERVTVCVLHGEMPGEPHPDGVLFVADSTTLGRSLPMLAEVRALGLPVALVLTMVDELKARGGELDLFRLQAQLGVPVVGVVGNRGLGLDDLRALLPAPKQWRQVVPPPEVASPEERFAWADGVLAAAQRKSPGPSEQTRRLDRVLLHPVWGLLVFFAFIAAFFQAIFSWAQPVMDLFGGLLDGFADNILASWPSGGVVAELLADGVVRGVGAVVVFVPQIALLFAMIFFFEASGYMARAAFVVDRVMGAAGLEGRCFISLLSSYACAVPGILATRSIPSPRDRLATILVAPFATCSARLPVYAVLIAAFIPATPVLGWFTLQGLTLFVLYLLGGVSAVLFAALFKRGMLRGASLPFYLELPPYRWPSFKSVFVQTWSRVKVFLRDAGTVILCGSIVLWFLLNFPRTEAAPGANALEARQVRIENSFAASIGKAMEPATAPLGFDWKVNIGLVGSFAARELMISTMAQVYAVPGDDDEYTGLAETLRTPDPVTGRPPLTLPSALSLLAFYVYALLCLSTVAAARRETGGWRWPIFMMLYMTAVAYVAAFGVYQLAN